MSDEAAPAVAPKVDPETLAIRSRPAGAIRFKRGAIVAIVAFGIGQPLHSGVDGVAATRSPPCDPAGRRHAAGRQGRQ